MQDQLDREVQHFLEKCMTVRQIREVLEGADGDSRVVFTCDYGDYNNTQQALPVGEISDANASDLSSSPYSLSRIRMNDGEEENSVEDDETVVVFRI